MRKKDCFAEALVKLNNNQKNAVENIEGPVMVVAGPGTGKTQVLTLRIANILRKTDTTPESILALTFTEAATREMRERLVNLIGKDGYRVRVGTFHSFCQEVIRDNPERFFIGEKNDNLSDLERNEIVQNILLEGQFGVIKPEASPLFYVRSINIAVQNLKREGVSPENFTRVLNRMRQELEEEEDLGKTERLKRERELNKNLELAEVYTSYQKELIKRGRFDFEDMINFVINAFKDDGDFLLGYQERFSYFLVDEYQDTNSAQNQLVFSLASFWKERANIFVVGDPNQSIYRFQGASMENFQEFIKRFPNSTLVNLTNNYRSSQLVLDSAHEVIINNKTQFSQLKREALIAKIDKSNDLISFGFFGRGIYEDFFVSEAIKNNWSSGVPLSEIAVIARHNQDLEELAFYLKRVGIPVIIEGGENILRTRVVRKIIKLLRVIDQIDSGYPETELFNLLYEDYLGFKKLEVVKFLRSDGEKRLTLTNKLLNTSKRKEFRELALKLVGWKGEEKNLTFLEFICKVIKESGLLDYILNNDDAVAKLNQLHALLNEIKKQISQNHDLDLGGFLKNIDLMEKQNINILEEPLRTNTEAVTLTTVHKAKGREWGAVFIYRFIDGKWGNNRNRELIKLPGDILEFGGKNYDQNEEERRLFYVALTRAKNKVYISGARNYEVGYGIRECLPSLFLTEIDNKRLELIEKERIERKAEKALAGVFAEAASDFLVTGEEFYLKELVANFKMSVTALNTYLSCAYKFKLNNLYRIPKAKEEYLSFGTAVHKALELFYQKYIKERSIPEKDFLIREFERALEKELLSEESLRRRMGQGQKILSAYYDYYQDRFEKPLMTEKHFGGMSYKRVMLDDIPLTGKVDRIDLIDLSKNTVRLVDYKTGKPKSRNEIEGKTKSADGSYKRQLIFYQTLSDLDNSFKHKMTEAELDFVEPDDSGRFRKERFVISEDEIIRLKEIISEVMSEIRLLNFQRTKDYFICKTCEFVDHCWPEGVPKTNNQNSQDS